MRFLEMVERRACEFPEAVAQRTSTGSQLTYGELWHASGALAQELVRRNASRTDGGHAPVLVYGHKSPLMLVGMLACMRSGHPYVPVDAHSVPDERAASIARQLGEPIVLAAESLPAAVAVSPEGVLSAADIRAVAERPPARKRRGRRRTAPGRSRPRQGSPRGPRAQRPSRRSYRSSSR